MMEHKNTTESTQFNESTQFSESTQLTGSPQCHDLLGSLSEFIDGTLNEELCNQIQQHMEGCENCRIVVDTLRKTVILYQATVAQPPTVPEEVRERLYHSLALDEFFKKK